jgi:cytochrome c6
MNFIQKKLVWIIFFLESSTIKMGTGGSVLESRKNSNAFQLFETNCVVCHQNGENTIIPEKNFEKKNLETNGMNSILAIRYQIRNGKNGMPAFGDRLKESDISEIANYILLESFKKTNEKE